jgi:hypothetical protein
MNYRKWYLPLVIIGFAAPWFFLLSFLQNDGISVPLFFKSIFVNTVSSAVAADLMVSVLVFFFFVFTEGRRTGVTSLWIYIPLTLFVGLSFALPLFLYNRARAIDGEQPARKQGARASRI